MVATNDLRYLLRETVTVEVDTGRESYVTDRVLQQWWAPELAESEGEWRDVAVVDGGRVVAPAEAA